MMNAVLNIGKFLFAISFLIFGIFHFMNAEAMAGMAFGSSLLVYLTGLALILATVSILLGRMDKLGTVLLGVFLLLTAFLVHLNGAMAGDQMATAAFLKDMALAGAAWMYAAHAAKDSAVIG